MSVYAARFAINRRSNRRGMLFGISRRFGAGGKPPRKKKDGLLVRFIKFVLRKFLGIFDVEIPDMIMEEIFFVGAICVTILSFLSLKGNAGVVGNFWIEIITQSIGLWGLYTLMIWLAIFATVHFIFRIEELLHASTLAGFLIFLTAITGLFSSSYESLEVLSSNIKNVGGYLGFYTLYIFRMGFGTTGSTVILSTLLCIGVLLASHIKISDLIMHVFEFIWNFITDLFKDHSTSITIKESDFIRKKELPKFKTQEIDGPDQSPEPMKVIEQPKVEVKKFVPVDDEDANLGWVFPEISFLNESEAGGTMSQKTLEDGAKLIHDKLAQFSIEVEVKEVEVGPTVVQYAIKPDDSVKLSKIIGLKQDLALALATPNIRIEAPIHGKSLVGIEVPKPKRTPVTLRELLETMNLYQDDDTKLFLPLGKDVSGKVLMAELSDMPHMLIAGSTGSGKSVCINAILVSLLYQRSPDTLKLIMVDPKHVELTNYNGLPHLLTPVITDPGKAIGALKWACSEMDRRYKVLSKAHARNLNEYHANLKEDDEYMPTIVIIIDELADLMMSGNKKDTESYICRIAQKARAVGIHLIIATQRPSVDVITGLIKANFPSRIAFAVTAGVDSKTILDSTGAEDLLGKGDMLYLPKDLPKPVRIQGCLVTGKEIEKIMRHIRTNTRYEDAPTLEFDEDGSEITVTKIDSGLGIAKVVPNHSSVLDIIDGDDDDNLIDAMKIVAKTGKASASLLQRSMRVGYARAASILDQLESKGLIGPANGAKPRDIYKDKFPSDVLED